MGSSILKVDMMHRQEEMQTRINGLSRYSVMKVPRPMTGLDTKLVIE